MRCILTAIDRMTRFAINKMLEIYDKKRGAGYYHDQMPEAEERISAEADGS